MASKIDATNNKRTQYISNDNWKAKYKYLRTGFLLELNIWSLPVLAKSVCVLVGVVCVAFFLELFVCRSFCVRYFSSFNSTFTFNIVIFLPCSSSSEWKFRLWRESSFYIRSVSRYDVKIENVFSKKYDLIFTSIYDAFFRSLSIFWWDTVFTARHLISEFRTWPRSFSSLFFFSWAWILVLSWSYDHIARTLRCSHNPWWFVEFISRTNLEMRPILILVVSLYELCDDLAIKLLYHEKNKNWRT